MEKSQATVDDIKFILAECARTQKDLWTKAKSLDLDDLVCRLPHPSGSGFVPCGRAAYQRLEKIIGRALKRAKLEHRADWDALRPEAARLLVQRFFIDKWDIDSRRADRFISDVEAAARSMCEDLTHFIPCHLIASDEPDVLDLGPVRFLGRRAFRARMLATLESERQSAPKRAKNTRTSLAEALAHCRRFKWVAEVRIEGCPPVTSKRIAEQAATSGIDCLNLIFGLKFSNKMRIGGSGLLTERSAGLAINPLDALSATIRFGWPGQAGFGKGWSRRLSEPNFVREFELCRIALECAVNTELDRPLSRRFLDAARWFGEATRDESPATQIVKYVTALERMLMTEEHDSIAHLVSERSAALCFELVPGDREQWRRKAKAVYGVRSKLLHGSMPPQDPTIQRHTVFAADIAKKSIFYCANGWGERGLQSTEINNRSLAKWFADLLELADRREAEAADPR